MTGWFAKSRMIREELQGWLASSISHRVTFAAVSLAITVALVIGGTSYTVMAVLVRHGIEAELDSQARLTLQKLRGDLTALCADLTTMAGNSFIANGLVDSLGRDTYLLPFLREHRPVIAAAHSSIVLCDFRGRPVASDKELLDLSAPVQAVVQRVLSSARAECRLIGLPQGSSLLLVEPVIFPPTGQAEGALVETVNLQELFSSEMNHMVGEYRARLLANGVPVTRLAAGVRESDLITVTHPVSLPPPLKDLNLSFEIGVSRSRAHRPLRLLALISLLCGATLLIAVIKLAKTTSDRLTGPLISLSATAQRIASGGSLLLSAEVTGTDEVGTLARVFNEMLTRLRASHEQLESQVEQRTRQLREAHDLLEIRVTERTLELTEANLRLEREIRTTAELEQQLRQVQKMEAVGTLAGGIAHDFNNLLTVIASYTSLTEMQMCDADPCRHHLEQIMTATEKAATLTRSLLAFSRKQVMDPQDCDLNEIIANIEKFLLRVIGEDIELVTELVPGELWVHLDRGQIEQVLMNLATNARDAMPRGGKLTLSTALETLDAEQLAAHGEPLAPGRYAVITASDSGCGMNTETVGKIFEPFFTTKEVGRGTGLGLAMVYGIIKQHNGHVSVGSVPGQGTTFRILLPALERQQAPRTPQPPTVSALRGSETLLLAEDDVEVGEVMRTILSEAGFRVIFAADGRDAVEKFARHRQEISLVILDMIMPRMSGKDAYREISRLEPAARVLFASGYTADFIKDRGELEDGAELIMKPMQPGELLRKVREMLDR